MTTGGPLTTGKAPRTLEGVLGSIINDAPGTQRVMLVSGDGLKLAYSDPDANAAAADRMAATMSGMQSLAKGAFRGEPGGVRQVIVEHDAGLLFLMSADVGTAKPEVVGTLLGVITSPDADTGQVGWVMRQLIKGLDGHLIVEARMLRQRVQ